MIEVFLGKISSADVMFVPDTPVLGLELIFSLDGGSIYIATNGMYGYNASKHTKYCKWSVEDQKLGAYEAMSFINKILIDAKVTCVSKLVGVPVEVTTDQNTFKSFRILKECL